MKTNEVEVSSKLYVYVVLALITTYYELLQDDNG